MEEAWILSQEFKSHFGTQMFFLKRKDYHSQMLKLCYWTKSNKLFFFNGKKDNYEFFSLPEKQEEF